MRLLQGLQRGLDTQLGQFVFLLPIFQGFQVTLLPELGLLLFPHFLHDLLNLILDLLQLDIFLDFFLLVLGLQCLNAVVTFQLINFLFLFFQSNGFFVAFLLLFLDFFILKSALHDQLSLHLVHSILHHFIILVCSFRILLNLVMLYLGTLSSFFFVRREVIIFQVHQLGSKLTLLAALRGQFCVAMISHEGQSLFEFLYEFGSVANIAGRGAKSKGIPLCGFEKNALRQSGLVFNSNIV